MTSLEILRKSQSKAPQGKIEFRSKIAEPCQKIIFLQEGKAHAQRETNKKTVLFQEVDNVHGEESPEHSPSISLCRTTRNNPQSRNEDTATQDWATKLSELSFWNRLEGKENDTQTRNHGMTGSVVLNNGKLSVMFNKGRKIRDEGFIMQNQK